MSDIDRIVRLSQGNRKALSVILSLIDRRGIAILDFLERDGIKGPDIWLLYKDICNRQLDSLELTLEHKTAASALQGNRHSTFYQGK